MKLDKTPTLPADPTTGTLQAATKNYVDAKLAAVPRGAVALAVISASTAGSTTTENVTALTVTATLTSGRLYRVSFFGCLRSSANDDKCQAKIIEGTTNVLATTGIRYQPNNGNFGSTCAVTYAGDGASHSFFIQTERVSGTGTVRITASSLVQSYILLEDIGLT